VNWSNAELRQLELTMFRAWPSFEAIDYDGWVLRFADGYTKRANSVNPHFGSSLPLEAKIATCEAAYRERGLPTIFRLTLFSQPEGLDERLAALGYETLDPTLVMTRSLDCTSGDEICSELIVSGEDWFDAFDELRKPETFERDAHRRIIESSEGERVFAAISVDGKPRACGLGVLVDGAIGLFDLFTRESYRGGGLASSIVRLILQWVCESEATTRFLQVHSQNFPARRLYERFGFEVAYPYWYRIKT